MHNGFSLLEIQCCALEQNSHSEHWRECMEEGGWLRFVAVVVGPFENHVLRSGGVVLDKHRDYQGSQLVTF